MHIQSECIADNQYSSRRSVLTSVQAATFSYILATLELLLHTAPGMHFSQDAGKVILCVILLRKHLACQRGLGPPFGTRSGARNPELNSTRQNPSQAALPSQAQAPRPRPWSSTQAILAIGPGKGSGVRSCMTDRMLSLSRTCALRCNFK